MSGPRDELRISCATSWACALTEARDSGVFERAWEVIEAAGFAGVDVSVGGGTDPEGLAHSLTLSRLPCTGLSVELTGEPAADRDRLLTWSSIARSAGLSGLAIRLGGGRRRSIEQWASFLAGWLRETAPPDLELLNGCGSRLEHPADFRELFVRLGDPRLAVAVDTLEFHRASIDPRAAVGELADRLRSLSLADAIGDRHVPLGAGEVNVRSVVERAARVPGLRRIVCNPPVTSWSAAPRELLDERRRLGALLEEAYTPPLEEP